MRLLWRSSGSICKICLCLCAVSATRIHAQTVSTVREAEFRSRWTDYQVDLRKDDDTLAPKTLRDMLRVGPIDLRGGMSVGWEYSNENLQTTSQKRTVRSSFFIAPTIGGLYEKDLGSWKVSARYSVGWVLYLEPDYVANGGGGNSSQTASLDLVRTGDRLTLRSNASASYGSGFDIDRAQQTTRLSVGEALSGEYQLGEFLRAGASARYGYDNYTYADNIPEDSGYRLSGGAYIDDFLTDKTALRFELSAGQESRSSGASTTSDRDYAQGIFRVNYGPTAKLSFVGSVGLGLLSDTNLSAEGQDGLRAVYSLSSTYVPTEKTSATLYLGIEGSTSKPEFNLAVNWHPRDHFALTLSAYQQTGVSLISVTTNQITRGVLVSLQQQFFSRITAGLSAGIEQSEYDNTTNSTLLSNDPYSFIGLSVGWQISDYLSWQMQLRTSSRRNASSTSLDGQQTRASMSLSLTF